MSRGEPVRSRETTPRDRLGDEDCGEKTRKRETRRAGRAGGSADVDGSGFLPVDYKSREVGNH